MIFLFFYNSNKGCCLVNGELVERRTNELFLERIDKAAEENYMSARSQAEKEIKSKYHM